MDYKVPTPTGMLQRAMGIIILFASVCSYAQSKQQVDLMRQSFNSSKLQAVTSKFEKDFSKKQQQLLQLAKAKGWKMTETLSNGNFSELQDVGPDGTPLYYTTLSDNVGTTSRASALYSNGALHLGIDGKGMMVGVWDSGVALTTHQEFDSRATILDDTYEVSPHATMVLSTLIASGVKAKAKGVAYRAKGITGNWTRDKIEVSKAAANGLLLSNHSYGIQPDRVPDWYFGSYIKVSQQWDAIMFNAPYYLMVSAAGNARKTMDNGSPISGTTSDGYDLLLGFSVSKNGITVAAADTEIDDHGNLITAKVAPYSSFGPVDDGRIKPDIAGGGSNIFAAYSTNDKSYNTSSGTSMATPGITGTMLLLQEYHEKLFGSYMKAATLKGLVLHSADDVNQPGPDYKMGWGIMNAQRASEIMLNKDYKSILSEETLDEGGTYSITVNADGTAPLMASISWTDPASENLNRDVINNAMPALVNDLDIRITKDGKTYYPWKLSAAQAGAAATKGDNHVDPFEKIEIDNASGEYTITVTHKGKLTNAQQHFSLVVSGISLSQCNAEAPSETKVTGTDDGTATITWGALKDAFYEVQYKEENATEWTTSYSDENKATFGNLEKGTSYQLRLRSFCTENIASEYTPMETFVYQGKETKLDDILEELTVDSPSPQISVYPNPAIERITVDGNVNPDAQYSIISTTGTILKEGMAKNANINVADLSSGLYILMVQDLSGVKTIKFYKG